MTRPRVWSDEEMLDAIRAQAVGGRPPTVKGWKGPPGRTSIKARFGSWGKAVEAAGFEARPPHRVRTQRDYVRTVAVAAVVRRAMNGDHWGVLCERAGMSDRQLRIVMNGEREFMTHRVADRLLCAVGRPDAWHVELEDVA